jgi:hypothetical protein
MAELLGGLLPLVFCVGVIVLIGGGIVLFTSVRIVPEYQRLVVLRLGRVLGQKGPGLVSWDFSAHKTFRPTEGHEIQFRLEAFNFPNRPNFGLPNPTFLNAAFGTIATTATTMREIQLGLKYVF